MNDSSAHGAPLLRLSKYKSKTTKRKSSSQLSTRKRRRKERIPIPSFSPIELECYKPSQKLDISLLDDETPVKKPPSSKPTAISRAEDLLATIQEDDDSDDEDLFTPAFSTKKPKENLSHGGETDYKTNEQENKKGEEPTKQSRISRKTPTDKALRETSTNDTVTSRMRDQRMKKKQTRSAKKNNSSFCTNEEGNEIESSQNRDSELHVNATFAEEGRDDAENVGTTNHPVTTSVAATPLVQEKNTQQPQPTPNTLVASVDHLFVDVEDENTVTIREVVDALQGIFNVELDRSNKTLVRNRLKNLVRGVVEPMDPMDHGTDTRKTPEPLANGIETPALATDELKAVQDTSSNRDETEKSKADNNKVDKLADQKGNDASDGALLEEDSKVDDASKSQPRAAPGKKRGRPRKTKADNETAEKAKDAGPSSTAVVIDEQDGNEPEIEIVKKKQASKTAGGGSKKRGRPRKQKTVNDTSGNQLDTETGTKGVASKKPAPRRPRNTTKKGSCALCTTCTCSNPVNVSDGAVVALSDMSKTDAQIEGALRRRLKKLETSANWYENQADTVRKEYNKHRRAMIKKQEEQLGLDSKGGTFGKDRSRFLPDADEWDAHLQAIEAPPLAQQHVIQAQSTVFASVPNYQPTLTQLLGQSSKPAGNEQDEENVEENSVVLGQAATHLSPVEDSDEEYVDVPEVSGSEDSHHEDQIHRVSWRQGERINEASPIKVSGLWGALSTRKDVSYEGKLDEVSTEGGGLSTPTEQRHSYSSPGDSPITSASFTSLWDHLFSEGSTQGESADFDQLLNLFQSSPDFSHRSEGTSLPEQHAVQRPRGSPEACSPVSSEVLSQKRRGMAETIEKKIEADVERLSAVEEACPNWKENIRFALYQCNEGDVTEAREKVAQSRRKLRDVKRKLLESIQRQEVVLELYETTLDASLERIAAKASMENNAMTDEVEVNSPNRTHSLSV